MNQRTKTFETEEERDEFMRTLEANACPYRGLWGVTKGREYGTGKPMLLWTTGSLD